MYSFFQITTTCEIYTLSLHDALPISVDYVSWFLDRLTREEAEQYYGRYVRPYFVPGRKADLAMAQRAIEAVAGEDRKSTRLNSSHPSISYAVFCLKKKIKRLATLMTC